MATRRCYTSAHLKLVRVLSDNFRQLVSRSTIGTLSELGILKYRGCRAGRPKVLPPPTTRHLCQSPFDATVVPHTSLLPSSSSLSPTPSALPMQAVVGLMTPVSVCALSLGELDVGPIVNDSPSSTLQKAASLLRPQAGTVTSSPTACLPPTQPKLPQLSAVASLNSSWCPPPSFSQSFDLSDTGDDAQSIPVITTRRTATRRVMTLSRDTDANISCARRWACGQRRDDSSTGRAAIRRRTRAALNVLRPPAFRAVPCCKLPAKSRGSDALSFIVVNAHSIAKSHALSTLAADTISTKADVICLTETWLKVKHSQSAFDLEGYACIRLDRKRRRGGGVAVYIKHDLSPITCMSAATGLSISDNHEFLWVRIK